ncbi:hypothetical protein J6590_027270 [Homalodisca vitripennis]|nr:hypothetical protein J6590_027270 [Homalodisca vitripennis]
MYIWRVQKVSTVSSYCRPSAAICVPRMSTSRPCSLAIDSRHFSFSSFNSFCNKIFERKDGKPAEIYCQLRVISGEDMMSEVMVRKWVKMFNGDRTNMHDENRSGRPSLVTDNLVRAVDQTIQENRRFTMTKLSDDFEQISRTLVCYTLNYRGYIRWWEPCTKRVWTN